jgi:hypothetical protein
MWLSKAFAKAMPVLGKIKNTIDKGLKIYDKGKSLYTEAKATASGIPIVGGMADELIKKEEAKAKAYVKTRTGVSVGDINKGANIARDVSRILPPSM